MNDLETSLMRRVSIRFWSKTQNPRVAVLSCADSRVPPEIVFDQGLGDLFVVRSAGESADPLAVGSLEYAVEHLGTVVIVVMGHQSCGAVKAACSGGKADSPNLEAVVTPIAASCTKVDKSKPDTFDLAAQDHVHSVAEELLAKSVILKKAADEGKLKIVEAYYSLDTGEVTKLR
jgi:carbonic anhydrase